MRVDDRLQPVFALISTQLTDDLAKAIAAGERAIHRWLESIGVLPVDFDDAHAFANINRRTTQADNGNQNRFIKLRAFATYDLYGGMKSFIPLNRDWRNTGVSLLKVSKPQRPW